MPAEAAYLISTRARIEVQVVRLQILHTEWTLQQIVGSSASLCVNAHLFMFTAHNDRVCVLR